MFKNLLKVSVLLLAMLFTQSCLVLAAPLVAVVLVVEEIPQKIKSKESFFGQPYIGFRTNVESMTGTEVFGHPADNVIDEGPSPAFFFFLPGNLALGTLFLPFDLWAMAFEEDDMGRAKEEAKKESAKKESKKEPLVAKLTPENQIHCRYARLESSKAIQMAEFKLIDKGVNLALSGKARQSATNKSDYASRAIDNRTRGGARHKSLSNTGKGPAWWEVDLGKEFPVDKLEVWKRTYFSKRKGHYPFGLDEFTISLYDSERKLVWKKTVRSHKRTICVPIRKDQTPECSF